MRILSTETRTWLFACALALSLAGCASTETSKPAEPAKSAPAKSEPASTTAPTPAATGIPAPSGDFANVVFFRESKFVGAMVGFKVREGEQELGKLSNGTYFVVQASPGPHAYTVHSEAKDVLNLEVERGQTYYVQGSISMGVMVGRPNLAPADAATFASMKAKLKDSGALGKK